jgi:hypothetical protein
MFPLYLTEDLLVSGTGMERRLKNQLVCLVHFWIERGLYGDV